MRIISGIHKGFRFPEKNMPHARPTTDRAKEALFNILDQFYYFEDISVLDLYSGLGSIALEFASRGTTELTAVEVNRKSIHYISEVAAKLNIKIEIKSSKVLKFLKNQTNKYDIIFADPPYKEAAEIAELVETMTEGDFLNEGGVFIIEHQSMTPISSPNIYETRNYGQSTFSFFKFEESK
ncbi:MAG: 16S rRNA (guanine(966)-N(2))-methyltransferase RsmD [Bacteroidetes bacterium]|nr:MAG: 16S rRNA (guanine(966)-N(2))-methyltransferase RsmD [Bacteroidota bacterium]